MDRRLFLGSTLAAAAAPLYAADRLVTPPLTEGPYYPDPIPAEQDWDLVRFGSRTALGQVLLVAGRLTRPDGAAIAGARVEIWQCDANGRYIHRNETFGAKPRDAGFQGFGAIITDAQGRYRFRTVRPPGYPMPGSWGGGMRTPHIHFAVDVAGQRRLATQMFFPDEPLNAQDGILRAAGEEGRAALLARLTGKQPDGSIGAAFDLVLRA